jgi:hypothetical protein
MVYGNYTTHIKKRDKLECSNYRAVTLPIVTYKVLSGVFYNRLTEYAEDILGEYQYRYCAHHSNIDHIFTIRRTQEKRMSIIYIYTICS